MNNWILRTGRAFTTVGALIAAQDPSKPYGFYCIALGTFLGVLFPETDGGKKAQEQLPETNK